MAKHRDPQTAAEWQEAVDAAYACLALDSAVQYGLATGPPVNVERCEEVLQAGKALGYTPRADAIERFVDEMNGQV